MIDALQVREVRWTGKWISETMRDENESGSESTSLPLYLALRIANVAGANDAVWPTAIRR